MALLIIVPVNIFAFYAITLFIKVMGNVEYGGDVDENRKKWQKAMLYSFAFGESFPSYRSFPC